MIDLGLAHALHVLAIVLWIGGVAIVTLVLIPNVLREGGTFEQFEAFEQRFARQSRITVLIAGVSGFYMVWRIDLWARFAEPRFWWMHAMTAVWLSFSAVLYVLEPLLLHRWFRARAVADAIGTMRRVRTLHRALLAVSLATIAGAVAGSHGVL